MRRFLLLLLGSGCGARSELYEPPIEETPRDGGCGVMTTLEVPTTTAWTDTGIDVTQGQTLEITATGVVRYGGDPRQVTDANGGTYYGKRFFTTGVLPDAVIVSLIGKIGGTTDFDNGTPLPEGTPGDGAGFVGTSYDRMVPENGRLFLGFNDQRQAFADNSGAFTITITVRC